MTSAVIYSAKRLQCQTCQHSLWDGTNDGDQVSGCNRFIFADTPQRVAMNALLFDLAQRAACPVRDALVIGPDSFISASLPRAANE